MGGIGKRRGGMVAGIPVLGHHAILQQPFFLEKSKALPGNQPGEKQLSHPLGYLLTLPVEISLTPSSGI